MTYLGSSFPSGIFMNCKENLGPRTVGESRSLIALSKSGLAFEHASEHAVSQLSDLAMSFSRETTCLVGEAVGIQFLTHTKLSMDSMRKQAASTLAAGAASQTQIDVEKDPIILLKGAMAFHTAVEIRKEPFELQKPDLKIALDNLKVRRRGGDCFQASFEHSEELLVRLVGRRKFDDQVAHIGQARKRFRLRSQIKV